MVERKAKKQIEKKLVKKKRKEVSYPVGDFLIKLKNAAMAKKHYVDFSQTKLVLAVAKTLEKAGYLDEVVKTDGKVSARITFKRKEPLIINIRLISTPGMRIYMGTEDLRERKGPTKFIISTSKGVMIDKEAIKKNLGGEVIAEVL